MPRHKDLKCKGMFVFEWFIQLILWDDIPVYLRLITNRLERKINQGLASALTFNHCTIISFPVTKGTDDSWNQLKSIILDMWRCHFIELYVSIFSKPFDSCNQEDESIKYVKREVRIDNRNKEVSTKLWYSMIGRLATRWLFSSSGVARACAHAHIIFTAVSKRDALS